MPDDSTHPPDPPVRMLPGAQPPGPPVSAIVSTSSPRQLADLPRDELELLAEEYGLDPRHYRTAQAMVSAIHQRRQLIASLDREAMLDVVRWSRRPVAVNATNEQLALEIIRIKSMRFDGLSERGLIALARLRDLEVSPGESVPSIVKKLKKKEGFWAKLNRKRRSILGSIVSSMLGESESTEYQFLPPQDGGPAASERGAGAAGGATAPPPGPPQRSIKEEIEESGLFGGIASRVKKTADQYINQKLDEIEARIDRKLDEIDRRLAEWRDKEIANRLRILKITLWASVIVGTVSLLYTYVKVNFWSPPHPPKNPPAQVQQK